MGILKERTIRVQVKPREIHEALSCSIGWGNRCSYLGKPSVKFRPGDDTLGTGWPESRGGGEEDNSGKGDIANMRGKSVQMGPVLQGRVIKSERLSSVPVSDPLAARSDVDDASVRLHFERYDRAAEERDDIDLSSRLLVEWNDKPMQDRVATEQEMADGCYFTTAADSLGTFVVWRKPGSHHTPISLFRHDNNAKACKDA